MATKMFTVATNMVIVDTKMVTVDTRTVIVQITQWLLWIIQLFELDYKEAISEFFFEAFVFVLITL